MRSRRTSTASRSRALDGDRLTPRQEQVFKLIVLGHTNHQTARILGISRRTVEVHRFNLMRRLRVHNVAQMMRAGLQHRLLRQHVLVADAPGANRFTIQKRPDGLPSLPRTPVGA